MNIEREMRAVEGQTALENPLEHSSAAAGNWLQARPEQSVVNDEQVYAALNRPVDRPRGSIHGGTDFRYRSGVFDLETIQRIRPIVDLVNVQMFVGVGDDLGQVGHARDSG